MDRFKTYKFFSLLFSYPESKEKFFKNLREFYPFENRKSLEDLENFNFEELQAEYTRLFVAGFGITPCKPYQSVFSTEDRSLMGAAAMETAKFLELFNLNVESDFPDKVSYQLEFMAFLLKLKDETPYPEDKRKLALLEREFFKRHILWMEKFADCILEHGEVEPLKVFAKLFKQFLKKERAILKV
jgi:TorA maturation chaperone TorD